MLQWVVGLIAYLANIMNTRNVHFHNTLLTQTSHMSRDYPQPTNVKGASSTIRAHY